MPGQQQDSIAEDLRLQGNDAFGTRDWERAVQLYQESVRASPSAKAYSNLAASLCKLGRSDEAEAPAARATALEPKWAKGWWRRGNVAELRKMFGPALQFYNIALELQPKERAFQKSVKDIQKRLNIVDTKKKKGPNGEYVVQDLPHAATRDGVETNPAAKAWFRMQDEFGSQNSYTLRSRYMATVEGSSEMILQRPTSQQYLFQGFSPWICGLKSAVGELSLCLSPEATMQWRARVARGFDSQEEAYGTAEEMLGGFPTGQAAAELSCGIVHLGGLYTSFEMGGGQGRRQLCPQPQFLTRYLAYQPIAVLYSVEGLFQMVWKQHGFQNDKNFRCAKSVLDASKTFYSNIGARYPHTIPKPKQDPSPPEIVQYIKQQLASGSKTWDRGLRQYVSLQYRGSILYACTLKMFGEFGPAYQVEEWAREFITLADQAFNVSKQEAFGEKGSAFRLDFRIGMHMSQFQTHNVLRGESIHGPYSMEQSLDLCLGIIEMANQVQVYGDNASFPEYTRVQNEVAWRRKPLALAHSAVASHLSTINELSNLETFKEVAAHHGFIPDADADCDPFALIAENYQVAATNELPDAPEAAVFWWAHGANMAFATPTSAYTLGNLRAAIQSARAAEQARDVYLFGPNQHEGGSYETVCKLVASHFEEKADDFVLPQATLVSEPGQKKSLKIGDAIICPDFGAYERAELERLKKNPYADLLDTTKLEKEHGASFEGIPSLETLCIRELHVAGYEHAKGEMDGAVIHYKAVMAANEEEAKE